MGITGLLPLLKSIMVPIHIKELEGCSVAVDTYSWLHKGALSCSKELCKGLPTNRHIQYCMHRVNLLRHYGVKPVLVFDGGLLPMKIEQENKRARSRKENLARAIEHESTGNSAAAYECYQKAVDISPAIAHGLIQVLKKENICYVVAPYEADAQMTFLAVSGQVDAVITEDSDLIPFGCPRIIYKMDKYGQGVEFLNSKLQYNKELSFAGFTKQMILEMCILSGCDYLQSLPGMGLKKAHVLIKKFKTYDKVIKHLSYNSISVPPSYEESFRKAILTFQHQLVYNPIGEALVHLSDIGNIPDTDLDFLGPLIPQHVAKGIAEGDLDPFTRLPFQGEDPSTTGTIDQTYHPQPLQLESGNKKLDLPAQKNLITKYFCFASLEAKREFKAPRATRNYSNPADESPLNLTEHVFRTSACQTNCYTPSLFGNVEDDSTSEVPSVSEPNEYDETMSPEHTRQGPSLLRQSSYPVHKPCVSVPKEQKCKTALGTNEVKIRTEKGKVIIRSRYFQQKSANNIDKDKNDDKPLVSDSGADENWGDQIRADKMKRKTSPSDTPEKENLKVKRIYSNDSLENDVDGYCVPNTEDEPSGFKGEKFGANISHLDHYSGIAEKSLDKYVSVISSFRFTGSAMRSGSRASGLRPPLKDLQNTVPNRPRVVKDLSEFAYVPTNRKPTVVSRRSRGRS